MEDKKHSTMALAGKESQAKEVSEEVVAEYVLPSGVSTGMTKAEYEEMLVAKGLDSKSLLKTKAEILSNGYRTVKAVSATMSTVDMMDPKSLKDLFTSVAQLNALTDELRMDKSASIPNRGNPKGVRVSVNVTNGGNPSLKPDIEIEPDEEF